MKVKSFFYGGVDQEKKEEKLNRFLARKDIVVEQIFQSAASQSMSLDMPQVINPIVIVTVIWRPK
jgi:hypothetical protein